MTDDLTRYRDALATILVMCDKDPCCPSCGHLTPNRTSDERADVEDGGVGTEGR